MQRALFILIMVSLCVSATAQAQLRIDEPVVEMYDDESLRQVSFYNDGEETVHITLGLQQVVSPATSNAFDEHTVPADVNVLSISPQVLHIAAKQSATALVSRPLTSLDTDEVYRLNVKPIRGPDASPIVLNYDLLLLVRPKKASPNVSLKRTSSGVALINQGNSNALMSSMQLCDQSINACHPLNTRRLYSKQRWTVPVPTHFNVDHLVLRTEQVHNLGRQVIEYRTSQLSTF